ncbi:MAG: endonuclease NucS [Bryobacteraceae bacterium]|nr:endonuclease NucS [Bryobacteraceae bacterium]
MPVEVAMWRLGEKLSPVSFSSIDSESRLEDLLADDISIVDPNLLLIGRQVPTPYGQFVDLLAIDSDGNLVVIELKRNRTPREVVAQLLDYGSWVRSLKADDVAGIFGDFLTKYDPQHVNTSLDSAFCERFGAEEMPEGINESHELMLVAGELDASTERIITYLAEEYGVAINAVFFRYFRDGDREYLSRAWLIDPRDVDVKVEEKRTNLPWNNEYYVSFGHKDDGNGRHWEDAQKYGFISAGGGDWYVRTLKLLKEDGRIWVNIPGRGYVGVGKVVEGPIVAGEFLVHNDTGEEVPITEVPLKGNLARPADNPHGTEEHLVRVEWIKTVPISQAVRERGFFGNQNSAAKPRSKRWVHTVNRLKSHFQISD